MRIKSEYREEKNTKTFEETFFAKYFEKDLFYEGDDIPTLGAARGKIYILRQFEVPENRIFGHPWARVNKLISYEIIEVNAEIEAIMKHY